MQMGSISQNRCRTRTSLSMSFYLIRNCPIILRVKLERSAHSIHDYHPST